MLFLFGVVRVVIFIPRRTSYEFVWVEVDLVFVGTFVIWVSPFFVIRIRSVVGEMVAASEYGVEERF